jgi:hypothetical protein
MTSQQELIVRKHEVRGLIERLRRELVQAQNLGDGTNRRRLRTLENELERLMAEEYRLRLAIDRNR